MNEHDVIALAEQLRDSMRAAMADLMDQSMSQDSWKKCSKIFEELSHSVASGQVRSASEYVRLAEEAQAVGVGTRLKTKSPAEELAVYLGVSKAEINRRLSIADAMRDRLNEHNESLGAKYPVVADLFMHGGTSIQVASTMVKELDKAQVVADANPAVNTEVTLERMESSLVNANKTGGSPLVHSVAKKWLNQLNTKDVKPSEELKRELQGLHFTGMKYGLHHGVFYFDDEQWAILLAGCTYEANPRVKAGTGSHADSGAGSGTVAGADGGTGALLNAAGSLLFEGGALTVDGAEQTAPEELLDRRSRNQKLGDGLIRSLKNVLGSNKLPVNGGYRPQVIVAIDHETLAGQVADSKTFLSHSAQAGDIDPSVIRRLACEANILPAVFNGEGRVLDVGAPQRLFTPEQRKILYARDLGCTAPGCQTPADGCEAHHVKEWSQGGPTTIDNGALVCHYHHKLIHETDWKIDIRSGVPYWVPPKSVDVNQKPIRNPYFHYGRGSLGVERN